MSIQAFVKRLFNRLLRRKCKACKKFTYVSFEMGTCCPHGWVPKPCLHHDSTPACEYWICKSKTCNCSK